MEGGGGGGERVLPECLSRWSCVVSHPVRFPCMRTTRAVGRGDSASTNFATPITKKAPIPILLIKVNLARETSRCKRVASPHRLGSSNLCCPPPPPPPRELVPCFLAQPLPARTMPSNKRPISTLPPPRPSSSAFVFLALLRSFLVLAAASGDRRCLASLPLPLARSAALLLLGLARCAGGGTTCRGFSLRRFAFPCVIDGLVSRPLSAADGCGFSGGGGFVHRSRARPARRRIERRRLGSLALLVGGLFVRDFRLCCRCSRCFGAVAAPNCRVRGQRGVRGGGSLAEDGS